MYDQNVIKRIKPTTILSVAYQWLGEETQVIACDKMSEEFLLRKLWVLLDEADIVIAHNGDSFDIKKINSRFIVHKLPPPSPYKTIDTKKEAKKIAGFDSNSLENLGTDMGEGEKIKHRGFTMWEGCMAGVQKDWDDMKRYNKRDVDLLVKVYLRLREWMKSHPTMVNDQTACPRGCNGTLQRRGTLVTKTVIYQRFKCNRCGGWCKGEKIENVVSRTTI